VTWVTTLEGSVEMHAVASAEPSGPSLPVVIAIVVGVVVAVLLLVLLVLFLLRRRQRTDAPLR
jgi:flagellar biogenesis protein FliO